MKVTEKQIAEMIADYKEGGYYDAVLNRSWDNMYIHSPKSKHFINGIPSCALWRKLIKGKISDLSLCKDFNTLYNELEKLKIAGIGDLLIYDTATCLGCPNMIFPDKIYVHAGVKKGLEALYGDRRYCSNKTLDMNTFINDFPVFADAGLQPIHIEDFLCIYHKDLNGNSEKGMRSRKHVRENKRECTCCC